MSDSSAPRNLPRLVPRNAVRLTPSLLARFFAWISVIFAWMFGQREAGAMSARVPESAASTEEAPSIDSEELRRKRLARFQNAAPSNQSQDPNLTELVSLPSQVSEEVTATEKPQHAPPPAAHKSILVSQSRPATSPSPTPAPSAAPVSQEPKNTPGVLLLRDLGIKIRGFSTGSTRLKTSLPSYINPIEVEYDMDGRKTGPDVHEVDSLLFCVSEKLNSPKEFFKYLMAVFKRLRPSRAWMSSVVRSINTQVVLLFEQESNAAEVLVAYLESASSNTDIMHNDEDYLTPSEMQAWIVSFASRVENAEQLSQFFNPVIAALVFKLAHMTSTGTRVLPTLSALRIFFAHPLLRTVLISHPNWNTPLQNNNGPALFDRTILGSLLSVSCVHQQDTGIVGFSSSSIAPNEKSKMVESFRSATNTLLLARSVMTSAIGDLVSSGDASHSDALLRWIADHVLNVPLKPHSTHYLLQWQHNLDLQKRDGFYTNLILAMLRATHLAGEALGSSAAKQASIDLSFLENNYYGIVFAEKSLLLDLESFKDRMIERSDSALAPFRTAAHTKFNAFFLTTWHLLQSTYVPITERFRAVSDNVRRLGQQERTATTTPGSNPQVIEMTRQQLGVASSRMYSLHIPLVTLNQPISDLLSFTSEWVLDTLHIDLSDFDNPEAIALHESFEAEYRRKSERSSEYLSREFPTPDAALCHLPAFFLETMNAHYKWRLVENVRVPFYDEYDRCWGYPPRVLQVLTHLFSHSRLNNPHASKSALEVFGALLAPLDDQPKTPQLSPEESQSHIERLTCPLIRFYVSIEKMGPRAFYDKFPVRRLIGSILRTPAAHAVLTRASLDHTLFMPFIMVLMNDSLYLLDETMLKLKSITELQATITRVNGLANRSSDDQQALREAEQNLQQSVGTLHALSTFGNESMMLFEVLSSVSLRALVSDKTAAAAKSLASSSFSSSSTDATVRVPVPVILDSNILEQLSVMLNYFLDQFATPHKRKKLQVSGVDVIDRVGALAFNPRQIISCLVLTYLNMEQMCAILHSYAPEGDMARDCFRKSIVSESRSYNLSIFEEALKIVVDKDIVFAPTSSRALRLEWVGNELSSSEVPPFSNAREAIAANSSVEANEIAGAGFVIQRLCRFIALLKESEEEAKSLDIPEADIPEHFLDAIMATLMRDPVRLPSGHVVDRSTIVRQLAGHDKSDPFTRLPLTMEQVVPEPDLRKEIEDWLKEARKRL